MPPNMVDGKEIATMEEEDSFGLWVPSVVEIPSWGLEWDRQARWRQRVP